MVRDQFNFRKQNQLGKDDKSLKQGWDSRIIGLCEKINKLPYYYTTSSCSGRVLLLKDCKEKRDDLFVKVWHDKIKVGEVREMLESVKEKGIFYFKQEPCILHVACKDLESAQKIHDIAKEAGWKRCGIIASNKRFVVELNATPKLEFPIIDGGRILVEGGFLEVVVKEGNKRMGLSWECIKRFEEMVGKL